MLAPLYALGTERICFDLYYIPRERNEQARRACANRRQERCVRYCGMFEHMDYERIAQQTREWSATEMISPRQRAVAQHLGELAAILSDTRYGCPSEHFAATVMYRYLCRSMLRSERR